MFGRQRRRIDSRQGRDVLRLEPREQDLIRQLLGELRELLALSPDDPRVRRLYPAAYAEDQESEERGESYESNRHARVGGVSGSVVWGAWDPFIIARPRRAAAVPRHATVEADSGAAETGWSRAGARSP